MSLSRKLASRLLTNQSSLKEVVTLLTKYRMLSLLPSVRTSMLQMLDVLEKKESIIIESPFPLSDESLQKIKRIVGNDMAKHEVVINKNILAGFQARFKGVLYDGGAQRIIKQLITTSK
jgi:F0F1-type ATP synthase delta subunit